MKTRRQFIFFTIPAALTLGYTASATAQASHVDENAAAAIALGYKHDASKVDAKKYPAYAAGKNCATCTLFQGKAGDAWAACGALGGKQVNAKGWCIAWAKKA
ncbi:high-potential iron-sulfur protein [Undibacterium sp.]|uniref:high-potential iron-sulfur protein n=1 Tax=Undibacterium sp. TaxID=1914977 RepID=UPI0025EE8086|nr:high-potential iron-sulfur protein [Undibacterium sp.]